MRARALWALAAASWLLGPALVSASPLFELVGSSEAGLNARATGASAASTYFNPALLPKAKQGLEVGFLLLNDAISVSVDARAREDDVPITALDRVRTEQPPVPTEWLERGCSPDGGRCVRDVAAAPRQAAGSSGEVRGYQLLGLVNHLLGESLSLGLYALVPLKSFTQAHSFFVDEREQYFSNSLHPELYADRLTPVSLAFGAGSRLWRGLYAGLSFTLGLNNGATASAYVGNSRLLDQTLELSTKVDVDVKVAPHGALSYELTRGSRLHFTVHSPQQITINTAFGIYLPNGDIQYAKRSATHAYLPWIASLAGSCDLARSERLTVELAATLGYERWSRYVNRQSERPHGQYAWRDVVVGALGLHLRRARWSALLDGNFRPTPVPAQTGRSNYVDNTRFGALAGAGYDVPIPSYGASFRIAAQLQLHGLVARHHRKRAPVAGGAAGPGDQLVRDEWPDDTLDVSRGELIAEAAGLQTNNPGWPGFSSRGFIVGSALTLALLY